MVLVPAVDSNQRPVYALYPQEIIPGVAFLAIYIAWLNCDAVGH